MISRKQPNEFWRDLIERQNRRANTCIGGRARHATLVASSWAITGAAAGGDDAPCRRAYPIKTQTAIKHVKYRELFGRALKPMIIGSSIRCWDLVRRERIVPPEG